MNKNIKILIWALLLLVVIIVWVILFNKLSNNNIVSIDEIDNVKTDINNNVVSDEELEQEVVLYNQILKKSENIDDINKCEQLKIDDIKNTCISSIEVKFWDMAQAKTLEDREWLEATENEVKEFRIDVCKYNLIKKMNREEINFEELCEQIIDEDVKNACLANF